MNDEKDKDEDQYSNIGNENCSIIIQMNIR